MSASKFHLNVSIARRVRAFCCSRSAQASDSARSCGLFYCPEATMTEPVTWLDRLRAERDELAAKVDKLAAFLDSGKTCQSGEAHHALLVAQLPHMRAYLDVLDQRIQLAEDDNAG